MADESNNNSEESKTIDLDEIKVKILLIVKNKSQFNSVGQFLERRGWKTLVATGMNDAISMLAKEEPDFVMISFNHPNPKLARLPNLLAHTFKTNCIGFCETPDLRTESRLTASKMKYKLMGAASGPSIHRRVKQILADIHGLNNDNNDVVKNNSNLSGKKTGTGSSGSSMDSENESQSKSGKNSFVQIKGGAQDELTGNSGPGMKDGKTSLSTGPSAKVFSNKSEKDNLSTAELMKKLQTALEDDDPASGSDELSASVDDGFENIMGEVSDGSSSNVNVSSSSSESHVSSELQKGQEVTAQGMEIQKGQELTAEGMEIAEGQRGEVGGSGVHKGEEASKGSELQKGQELTAEGLQVAEGHKGEVGGAGVQKGEEASKGSEFQKGGLPSDGSEFQSDEKLDQNPSMKSGEASENASSMSGGGRTSDQEDSGGNHNVFESELNNGVVGAEKEERAATSQEKEESLDTLKSIFNEKESKAPELSSESRVTKNEEFQEENEPIVDCLIRAIKEIAPSKENANEKYLEGESICSVPFKTEKLNGYLTFFSNVSEHQSEIYVSKFMEIYKRLLDNEHIKCHYQEPISVKAIKTNFESWMEEQSEFFVKEKMGEGFICVSFVVSDIEIPKLDLDESEEMLKINPASVFPEKPLNFDAFIYLSKSDKYFLYTKDGRYISDKQQSKLIDKGVDLYISNKDIEIYKRYIATNVLNDLIDHFISSKKKAG